MEDLEDCLARIGYRRAGREAEHWKVSNVDASGPVHGRSAVARPSDPAYSAALRFWLKRLGEDEGFMPYRIRPVGGG